MSEGISQNRRQFLSAAAMTIAAAEFALIGTGDAQPRSIDAADASAIKPESNQSFGPLKQVDAGVLNVGYAEAGSANGHPVILLHGWPYDIHSYVDVAPLLASAGYRVIVPYLRGYGATRFLSSEAFRNGQPSSIALDIIALMDVLKIDKAVLGGFDWGARTANIIAALWPERCKAMVSVSGYLIGSQASGKAPLPPKAELQWWYQFYFATERGRAGYDKYRHDFRSSSGSSLRRNGTSMLPRSIAAQRPSTTRIMSPSSSTTIAGGSAWLKASRNMTILKSDWPKVRSSPCPPLLSKAMPMARHTRMPVPMRASFRADMNTE